MLSCHIFSAQYSKRYTYSSHCGPFEAEHSKRNQNRFFKPLKCTNGTPGHYIWEYLLVAKWRPLCVFEGSVKDLAKVLNY